MVKKDNIIELIGKDDLNGAFKKFLNHFDTSMKNDLYKVEYETTQLLNGRLKNIKKQKIRGTIRDENFDTEKNKIRDSFLNFINDLPEEFWKKNNGTINNFYISTLMVLSLSFMLGYYIYLQYPEYDNILKADAWHKSIYPNDSAKLNESKLEIKSRECTNAKFIQNIQLQPQTDYKISYSIVLEDVLEACKNVGNNLNMWGASICVRNDQTKLVKRETYFSTQNLTNEQLIFNSKDAKKAKLYLQLGGDGGLTTGYVQFKDVEIQKIE